MHPNRVKVGLKNKDLYFKEIPFSTSEMRPKENNMGASSKCTRNDLSPQLTLKPSCRFVGMRGAYMLSSERKTLNDLRASKCNKLAQEGDTCH